MGKRKLISVVVPVFNEEEVIEESYRRLTKVMSGIEDDYELIMINDGSADKTLDKLEQLGKRDERLRFISFTRNFGHQIAISAGMDEALGDAIVVIDADLQDPPEVIPEMINKWKAGYDVVYGKRSKREGETFFKKFTATMFYRVLDNLTEVKIPVDTGDFRLIDRNVNLIMSSLKEKNRYVRGLVSWIGFKQYALEYVRHERFAGETKYSMGKMLKLAVDGITTFSNKPLMFGLYIAPAIYLITFLLLLGKVTFSWIDYSYFDLVMMFLVGTVFAYLGGIGLYLGRIYNEGLDRPLYIIDEGRSGYKKMVDGE